MRGLAGMYYLGLRFFKYHLVKIFKTWTLILTLNIIKKTWHSGIRDYLQSYLLYYEILPNTGNGSNKIYDIDMNPLS